ncbi:uroporphyrinogen-III C-methyltransferase [Leptospira wolffii]|uniref:uroporphyrinogen-III C-methyltransferase n=1 Tax=Leptospira wolffii TaxID=409998 RepID=A0A2M9Z7Q4_9LEPT|nr:uroporphyrinogen-III C-methyltransferase [Leptospira wolffii]PJZ64397.1 uroporphyrinogen-III C-methyltransferase [Leptospira wolffii]
MPEKRFGKVYLLGAGPGDPDLLTVKAHKILRKAQVVLYDDLVSLQLLKICRKDTKLVYVGKRIGVHSFVQETINLKIEEAAEQFRHVVRLKGGDPSVFGRVGEEYFYLLSRGIECEIVAGITTASGAAASLGFPLTHRDYSQEIVFLTGHKKDGKNEEGFLHLDCKGKTLVVYMGFRSLEIIVSSLLKSGNSPETPIALIESATTPKQKIRTSTLENVGKIALKSDTDSPILIIIGDIIRFYERMRELRETSSYLDSPVP